MTAKPQRPYPGSSAAVAIGCLCRVMDNSHGLGRGCDGHRWGWYVSGDCPIHAEPVDRDGDQVMTELPTPFTGDNQ